MSSDPVENKSKPAAGSPNVSGAYVEGNVNTGGGDFVGRDKNVYQLPLEPVVKALHQIPSPPPDFIGREKEIEELLIAIAQGGLRISCLQGMGGVGKTSLVVEWMARQAAAG